MLGAAGPSTQGPPASGVSGPGGCCLPAAHPPPAAVTVTGSGLTEPASAGPGEATAGGTSQAQRWRGALPRAQPASRPGPGSELSWGGGVAAPAGSGRAGAAAQDACPPSPARRALPAFGAISAPAHPARDPHALPLALPGTPSRPSVSADLGPRGSSPPLRYLQGGRVPRRLLPAVCLSVSLSLRAGEASGSPLPPSAPPYCHPRTPSCLLPPAGPAASRL